jgi:hypothetical protein
MDECGRIIYKVGNLDDQDVQKMDIEEYECG